VDGRDAVQRLKEMQNGKQQCDVEFVDLDARKQTLQRAVASRQEKLDKVLLQHRVKEDAMKAQLQELHK